MARVVNAHLLDMAVCQPFVTSSIRIPSQDQAAFAGTQLAGIVQAQAIGAQWLRVRACVSVVSLGH
jgi:hypothetical protein